MAAYFLDFLVNQPGNTGYNVFCITNATVINFVQPAYTYTVLHTLVSDPGIQCYKSYVLNFMSPTWFKEDRLSSLPVDLKVQSTAHAGSCLVHEIACRRKLHVNSNHLHEVRYCIDNEWWSFGSKSCSVSTSVCKYCIQSNIPHHTLTRYAMFWKFLLPHSFILCC